MEQVENALGVKRRVIRLLSAKDQNVGLGKNPEFCLYAGEHGNDFQKYQMQRRRTPHR